MAYEDLEQHEQEDLQTYLQDERTWTIDIVDMIEQAKSLRYMYDASVFAILQQLAPGDEIPDESNLKGATNVTQSECNEVQINHCDWMVTEFDTPSRRQMYTKFGGINNEPVEG